ncbi:hypothetical protein [Aurantiacibacter sp. D1-12]|uniref:hypothetical protein n=1 Tax=Aurantiacibacter sp. D1-12 TaxID=2993658 RepID=UPI00237D28BE|nr:hypothetical protein [Aurantiacibacter sp. D1-12]MDE1467392.1 hypothetical protein [Aurantiacibacter sp. D1-12]
MTIKESLFELGSLLAVLVTVLLILIRIGDGTLYMMSFPVQILGLIMMIVAILKNRSWWILAFAPILIYPLYGWAALLYSCFNGDCL